MIDVTKETFAQEVLQATVPVLVDFWAPWCGPCRAAAPALEALDAEFAGQIKVVKVNVDEQGALASEHQVRGIPSFMIFSKGQSGPMIVGFSDSVIGKLKSILQEKLGG